MGARYYAPALGRFLSRDPSGFVAGPNLYAYCLDDPVNTFDATGQYPEWVESIFNRRNLVGAVGAGAGFFGGGPMGAVGGWFAGTGLCDATENLGDTVGRYEGGKASSADVWWASGRVALNVGLAVFPTFNMARGAGGAGGAAILADTNLLVNAMKGNANALAELRAASTVYVTPNQFREFLAGGAGRRAFLRANGIQVFGGPTAGAIARSADFQATFGAYAAAQGRGDAALVAFARTTGIQAVTMDRRLYRFITLTRFDSTIPVRLVSP